MKSILTALMLMIAAPATADHVPDASGAGMLARYQHDAAQKRYADLFRISDLLDRHIAATGSLPLPDPNETALYQVAVLGQPEAVDAVFRNGTPFGFSLVKYRPAVLHDLLKTGLGTPVRLPLDPQRVGTHFAPVYFVFMRAANAATPAHYIVLGTFAQPVARSTQVAPNVHLVALANADVEFIVPVHQRRDFAASLITHALAAGDQVDRQFARTVTVALE